MYENIGKLFQFSFGIFVILLSYFLLFSGVAKLSVVNFFKWLDEADEDDAEGDNTK